MMKWRVRVFVPVLMGFWSVLVGAADPMPSDPPMRYWKGNLHTHSLWSDGDDFPEMIAEWYRTHGYNFLAISDHNVLSRGARWMKVDTVLERGGRSAMEKYLQRFGDAWVETRGLPDSPEFEVRLKPLDEFRYLVEQREEFILIPAEEISDRAEGVPLHLNATNLIEVIEPQGGATIPEAMSNNLRAVRAQAERAGREILLHLNHPNFGYAITAEDLASVIQEKFFEVYNGHPGVAHQGDAAHPSVERIWDIANTIRIGELRAAPLYGVATDDSHNYHGKPGSHTGRGWVMVQARFLTPEHLVRSMNRGDFYASSGVTFDGIDWEPQTHTLAIRIHATPGTRYQTRFIGTRTGYDPGSTAREGVPGRVTRKYSSSIGEVLAEVDGDSPRYVCQGDELYIRAVVTASEPHSDPSFAGQQKQAWTQPVVVRP